MGRDDKGYTVEKERNVNMLKTNSLKFFVTLIALFGTVVETPIFANITTPGLVAPGRQDQRSPDSRDLQSWRLGKEQGNQRLRVPGRRFAFPISPCGYDGLPSLLAKGIVWILAGGALIVSAAIDPCSRPDFPG